jgi:hypothetical protein
MIHPLLKKGGSLFRFHFLQGVANILRSAIVVLAIILGTVNFRLLVMDTSMHTQIAM